MHHFTKKLLNNCSWYLSEPSSKAPTTKLLGQRPYQTPTARHDRIQTRLFFFFKKKKDELPHSMTWHDIAKTMADWLAGRLVSDSETNWTIRRGWSTNRQTDRQQITRMIVLLYGETTKQVHRIWCQNVQQYSVLGQLFELLSDPLIRESHVAY